MTELCPLSHKHKYPNQKAARLVALLVRKKKNLKLYVYRCPHCNHWHLTRRTPQEFATLKESYGR